MTYIVLGHHMARQGAEAGVGAFRGGDSGTICLNDEFSA